MATTDDASTRLRDMLPLERTALLVHDVQNDFCSPGGAIYDRAAAGAETAMERFIENVATLVAAARTSGVRVIYLKNTHLAQGADLPDARRRDGVAVIAGTWGHQVVDRVAPLAGDIVVEKSGYDVFRYSMLGKVVRARRLEAFVLAGLSTYSGILASHYALMDLGYTFVIPREAVTGHELTLHEAALRIMASHVVGMPAVLDLWNAER